MHLFAQVPHISQLHEPRRMIKALQLQTASNFLFIISGTKCRCWCTSEQHAAIWTGCGLLVSCLEMWEVHHEQCSGHKSIRNQSWAEMNMFLLCSSEYYSMVVSVSASSIFTGIFSSERVAYFYSFRRWGNENMPFRSSTLRNEHTDTQPQTLRYSDGRIYN